MPVINRTLLDLSAVSASGALQGLVITSGGVNVPGAMRQALLDGLERKGYQARWSEPSQEEIDYHQPFPPGENPAFDAVLYCDIFRWSKAEPAAGGRIEVSGTVEMVRAGEAARGGGEILYRKEYYYVPRFSSGGVRTTNDLVVEVRRAALRGISDLPSLKEAEAPDSLTSEKRSEPNGASGEHSP